MSGIGYGLRAACLIAAAAVALPIFASDAGAGPVPYSWTGFYVDLEAGGGLASNYYNVTPGLNVNGWGGAGGAAVGWRTPINASPDSLVFPDGARFGVLGGSFNGTTFYPTDGFTYGVKSPFAFYGEGEFANLMIDTFVGMLLPNAPIRIYSTAGVAGVVQNFNWTMPGVSGSTNVLDFAATTSIRVEFPVANGTDMYLQWRTFYMPGQSVGIPAPVIVKGIINVVTLGAQFNTGVFTGVMPR